MKLLYFKEHLSCMNYQVDVNTGFVCYNLEKDNVSQIDNSASPCIFFLLDGEVSIDSGEYQNVHVEKDEMLLIPQHVDNKIEVIYDAKCLLLFWNKDIRVCDKVYINSLSSYEKKKEVSNTEIILRNRLVSVHIYMPKCNVNICILSNSKRSCWF